MRLSGGYQWAGRSVDFEKTWERLSEGVLAVVTMTKSNAVSPMVEDVYRCCIGGKAQKLYVELNKCLQTFVSKLVEELNDCKDTDFLLQYHLRWDNFSTGCRYLNNIIFRYLNKNWVTSFKKKSLAGKQMGGMSSTMFAQPGRGSSFGPTEQGAQEELVTLGVPVLEVGNLGLYTWKNHLYTKVKERLLSCLLNEIQQARMSGSNVRHELQGIIGSYKKMSTIDQTHRMRFYGVEFEKPFLLDTAEYYRRKVQLAIQELSVSEYLRTIEKHLGEEELRSRLIVDASTNPRVKILLDKVLVQENLALICSAIDPSVEIFLQREPDQTIKFSDDWSLKKSPTEEGPGGSASGEYGKRGIVDELGRSDEAEDLLRMFRLLSFNEESRQTLLRDVQESMAKFGKREVAKVVQNANPIAFVEYLLDYFLRLKGLVITCFNKDEKVMARMDQAFKEVMNDHKISMDNGGIVTTPLLVARFCDLMLKGRLDKEKGRLVEQMIEGMVVLFKYMDDRDVFHAFYVDFLSKRLLTRTSHSEDLERAMLKSLRAAFGFGFVSKIHKMFTDKQNSEEFVERFRSSEAAVNPPFDYNAIVLTKGCWKVSKRFSFQLKQTETMKALTDAFETFYSRTYQKRKLQWLHHASHMEVRTNFAKRPYIVTVSAMQYAVLESFNSTSILSFGTLLKALCANSDELEIILKSLLHVKLLKRKPEGSQITNETQFALRSNIAFKILKVNAMRVIDRRVSAREGNQEVVEAAQSNRKYLVEAAIVRIMKTRKELSHQLLVQEVMSQLQRNFTPPVTMVKKSLESLIDKEYLERVPDSAVNAYRYLA